MATERVEKYASSSKEFLAKTQEALKQVDLAQASGKGWGAAAQMVTALAERRGWPHNTHVDLWQVVTRLEQETGELLLPLFHNANSLHRNFYEDDMPREAVEAGLEEVRILVSKLEQLL